MIEDMCSEDKLKDFLKDFFSGRNSYSLAKKKFRSKNGDPELFLLCLDNIEEMIISDEDGNFKAFLSELYDDCPNLRILVTSILTLGTLPNQHVPEV